eukprot:3790806-Amphidinium_carterae.4
MAPPPRIVDRVKAELSSINWRRICSKAISATRRPPRMSGTLGGSHPMTAVVSRTTNGSDMSTD